MEIILAEGNLPVAYAIKKATGFHFTHTSLRYSHPEDNWMVHASIGGVQPDWWHSFQKRYESIARYKCKFDCADTVLDQLVLSIAHKSYGYMELLGAGIVVGLESIGVNLRKNPLSSNGTFLCTDVVSEFFEEANRLDKSLGLMEFRGVTLTPKALQRYLRSRQDVFEEIV